MQHAVLYKNIVILTIVLFIGAGVVSGFNKITTKNPEPLEYIPGTYLCATQWGQHGYYKQLCPKYIDFTEDEPKILTCRLGCWSVALAQIIRYYELQSSGNVEYTCSHNLLSFPLLVFPHHITNHVGIHTYDWSLMPYNLTSSSSTDEIEMTRQFCYDVACVIQKDFGTGGYVTLGESFDIECLKDEFLDHFPHIDQLIWVEELQVSHIIWQLDHFHPIMLYIRSGGERVGTKEYHAVVLDGYQWNQGTFEVHLNYGWDAGNPDSLTDSWYPYDGPFPDYDDTTFRKGLLVITDPPPQLVQIAKAGLTRTAYTFQAKTNNRMVSTVSYQFDWGDGTMSDWIGRYDPGIWCNASHSWNESGVYVIRARASDMVEWESNWSEPRLFYIPKYPRMFPLVEGLFDLTDRFPRLEPLLLPIIERLCQ
jgi:hypothetical protein